MKPNPSEVRARLRLFRERFNLTQAEICRRTGTTPRAWNMIEQRGRIGVDAMQRVRAAFGISSDWVWCGDVRCLSVAQFATLYPGRGLRGIDGWSGKLSEGAR